MLTRKNNITNAIRTTSKYGYYGILIAIIFFAVPTINTWMENIQEGIG